MMATDVLCGSSKWSIVKADVLDFLDSIPAGAVDLVMCSPPYEQARLYLENGEDMGIARDTEEWVSWMVKVFKASLRICRGLVCAVVEGQTRNFRWSASPALLMADLHRAGIHLRKPPAYHRVGIPGSGGPDFLRNDYEFCVCATNGGKLPWSENTAMGHPPKWAPGGDMSYRNQEGCRKNARGYSGAKRVPRGKNVNGDLLCKDSYLPPAKANPGNVITCKVGGGLLGSQLAHQNEAPYPERLAEFFVRSFCLEGGIVCDPFSGSGTTGAVALKWGRRFVGCDLRQSQVNLTTRRLKGETTLFA